MGWVSELGADKDAQNYGGARKALAALPTAEDELRAKSQRTFGGGNAPASATHYEHFGPVLVSCERGDIRLTPDGLHVHGDFARAFRPAPAMRHARAELTDAIFARLRGGTVPLQTGEWGLATLEIAHAILESASEGRTIKLQHQCAA